MNIKSIDLDFRRNPCILSALVDTIKTGVFSVDDKGIFVAWSAGAEKLTGYSSYQIVGKPVSEIPAGSTQESFSSLNKVLKTQPSNDLEIFQSTWSLITARGRERFVEVSFRTLKQQNGHPLGIIGTFGDIPSLYSDADNVAISVTKEVLQNSLSFFAGESTSKKECLKKMKQAAKSNYPVCLLGEPGAGKALAAKIIHALSERCHSPFLSINCTAIPSIMIEQEIFGYGDAFIKKLGGGSLYLEGIGSLDLNLQKKLCALFELPQNASEPVRTTKPRLIVSSKESLPLLLKTKKICPKFHKLISHQEITIPSLRERKNDIVELCKVFQTAVSEKVETVTSPALEEDALRCFLEYPWPGNVRELKSVVEHACITLKGDTITLDDIPLNIQFPNSQSSVYLEKDLRFAAINEAERHRITTTLKKANWNQSHAAKQLGFSRVTLWKKIKRLGIEIKKEF